MTTTHNTGTVARRPALQERRRVARGPHLRVRRARKSACEQLLKLVDALMPGIGGLALQDYQLVNDAPLAAFRAIAKAEGR